jgi:hypothetical protein
MKATDSVALQVQRVGLDGRWKISSNNERRKIFNV